MRFTVQRGPTCIAEIVSHSGITRLSSPPGRRRCVWGADAATVCTMARGEMKAKQAALYERLMAAFSATPGDIVKASQAAGCSYNTAKAMWYVGGIRSGLPPIKDELEQSALRAKAARAAARAAETTPERDRAIDALVRSDADKVRLEIAQLSQAVRGATLSGFTIVGRQLKDVEGLNRILTVDLEKFATNPWIDVERDGKGKVTKQRRVTPDEILRWQGMVSQSISRLVRAALDGIQIERLHLGLPAAKLDANEMTLDEAIREIQTGMAELQQAERQGLIIIQGGRSTG